MIRTARLPGLHPVVETLRAEAEQEGFRFLTRLVTEWRTGANRFDRPGESLLGALEGDELVGICGLNRDPYLDDDRVGRLRHLYIGRTMRRRGIASALVVDVLISANGMFDCVRLRTETSEVACFYEKLGFVRTVDATASHVRVVR